MFCFVSIVKRGHLLLLVFGFPQNKKNENEKIQKIYQKNIRKKSKKIIGARKGLEC
jgi:hypothetical protein